MSANEDTELTTMQVFLTKKDKLEWYRSLSDEERAQVGRELSEYFDNVMLAFNQWAIELSLNIMGIYQAITDLYNLTQESIKEQDTKEDDETGTEK